MAPGLLVFVPVSRGLCLGHETVALAKLAFVANEACLPAAVAARAGLSSGIVFLRLLPGDHLRALAIGAVFTAAATRVNFSARANSASSSTKTPAKRAASQAWNTNRNHSAPEAADFLRDRLCKATAASTPSLRPIVQPHTHLVEHDEFGASTNVPLPQR